MTIAAILGPLRIPVTWDVLLLSAIALCLVLWLRKERQERKEAADLHLRTIHALALAIDARDNTAPGHLRRLQAYATGLGSRLGLDPRELRALETAALLHDVGELAVPENIVAKPGRLTRDEMEKLKIHPIVAAEILETVRFPYPVAPIVRAHHERWDGSGYPFGLKGEEIPIGARILAAVDCLNALATDRKYRRALPLDEAMRVIETQSGTCFDPAVVQALVECHVELEREAREAAMLPAPGALTAHGSGSVSGDATDGPPESRESFAVSIAAARQEFQALHELASELGNSLSLKETLSLLALRLRHLVPHDAIAIYVGRGERLVAEYVHGEIVRLSGSPEIELGEGPSGWAARNNRPVLNADPVAELQRFTSSDPSVQLRSALCVPLEGMGGVIGALTLYHQNSGAFTREHLRILRAVGSKAGLTIENAVRFQLAATSAVTDELTGLPNARSLFLQLHRELARCKRTRSSLALLVIDLDGFKYVNDRFGHLEGNKVLQLTAAGLRASCREYDYVARMGGDEFVLILPGAEPDVVLTRLHQLETVARRAGAQVCGEELLSLSVGDAFFPEDGDDAEQLLALADRRMYQMKQAHRSQQGFLANGSEQVFTAGPDAYGAAP
jgi:diguanylate cyclase (GGDEF)-like protein